LVYNFDHIDNLWKSTIFGLDRRICGENQIPALSFEKLGGDKEEAVVLAWDRIKLAIATGIEIFGRGLATFGLSSKAPPAIFGLSAGLIVASGMYRIHEKNNSGSRWSLLLLNKVSGLGPHRRAVEATLINAGIATEEVEGLFNLSNNVYNAELAGVNLQKWRDSLIPVSSGVAMSMYGDYLSALVVTILGLSSFPLGEKFYRESNVVRAAESRAGRSAKIGEYIKKVQREHIAMTDKVNFLSYTPELLFALKYLTKSGNALPALYGFQQGLQGLTGVLNSQRIRESTKRTTEIAMHLVEAISNRPFIATPQRWREHVKEARDNDLPGVGLRNGLVIRNFTAQLPTGEKTGLAPISVEAALNSAVIIRAESGAGKSVTLMGIMHLLEHAGSIFIIKKGKKVNVHSLKGPEEVAQEILLVTDEGVNENDRVADLFKEYFLESNEGMYEAHRRKNDPLLTELAWKMADNLLEKEIEKLEKSEKGVFPKTMESVLREIRDQRNLWVSGCLSKQGGNIASEGIKPERVFSTLSAGEKRRMLVAVAEVAVLSRPRTAVILDEPLAHLDSKNRELQLRALKRIEEGKSPVALLIVSHENIEELESSLNNCQMVEIKKEAMDGSKN
jgi:energy-coupling factor transporter ATP-binding protein EcfA2